MRKWQQYTPEFKAEALRRLKGMRERWRARPRAEGAPGHPVQAGGRSRKKRSGPVVDSPAIAALKKEVVQLKVALADKSLEADFFKGALQSKKTVCNEDHRRYNRWRPGIPSRFLDR